MQLVTWVPAAERVESVHGRDPKLLAWLGARRAGSDGAQAQTLVVTETRLLHQLLHGGLLWGSQGAGGQQLPVVRYWNTSQQIGAFFFLALILFYCLDPQLISSLTRNVIIFMPGHSAASVIFLQGTLAASAHGDLSSPLCPLHNSFGQCSTRRARQSLVNDN